MWLRRLLLSNEQLSIAIPPLILIAAVVLAWSLPFGDLKSAARMIVLFAFANIMGRLAYAAMEGIEYGEGDD